MPPRASSGSSDPSRASNGRAAGSGGGNSSSSSSSSSGEHAATTSSSSNGALLEGSASGGCGGSAPQAASVAPSSPAAHQPGTNWLSGRNIALGGSVATVLLLTVFRKEIAPVRLLPRHLRVCKGMPVRACMRGCGAVYS